MSPLYNTQTNGGYAPAHGGSRPTHALKHCAEVAAATVLADGGSRPTGALKHCAQVAAAAERAALAVPAELRASEGAVP